MMLPLELNALNRKPFVLNSVDSSYERRPECWRSISRSQWQSYSWQWEHRLLSLEDLGRAIALDEDDRQAIRATQSSFSVALSPHFAALIHPELGRDCPIRRQAIPDLRELIHHGELLDDPLGESRHAIAHCAIRRYPDRALIYATHECAMRCRHCTRRSRVGLMESIGPDDIQEAIHAIVSNDSVRDVLISGGDPLTLPNAQLDIIFDKLKSCPHIDVVRLCTRMISTQPQRIFDPDLLAILKKYEPIYVNTQFNHPCEATQEAEHAFQLLRNAGCILGNQSVLLKNINDNADTLEPLYRWLLRNGCRPYYLFLCDVAQGTYHFRTSIQAGLNIMKQLRGRLSGLAIPHFVIDLPDGFGKVDLAPDSLISAHDSRLTFRNWFGADIDYQEPDA